MRQTVCFTSEALSSAITGCLDGALQRQMIARQPADFRDTHHLACFLRRFQYQVGRSETAYSAQSPAQLIFEAWLRGDNV